MAIVWFEALRPSCVRLPIALCVPTCRCTLCALMPAKRAALLLVKLPTILTSCVCAAFELLFQHVRVCVPVVLMVKLDSVSC